MSDKRTFCSQACASQENMRIRYKDYVPTSWTPYVKKFRRENDMGTICMICGKEEFSVSKKAHHLDHCHKTGAIRGLLCNTCNTHLGWYEAHAEQIGRYLNGAS